MILKLKVFQKNNEDKETMKTMETWNITSRD